MKTKTTEHPFVVHSKGLLYDKLKEQMDVLLQALGEIINECPNPKLPYGIRIKEIALTAIKKNSND